MCFRWAADQGHPTRVDSRRRHEQHPVYPLAGHMFSVAGGETPHRQHRVLQVIEEAEAEHHVGRSEALLERIDQELLVVAEANVITGDIQEKYGFLTSISVYHLAVLPAIFVIGPVLNVLNTSFGFQGMPGAGPNALAAPQAALISTIAQGVLGGTLKWNLIGMGAAIGAGAVVVDELLRQQGDRTDEPMLDLGFFQPISDEINRFVMGFSSRWPFITEFRRWSKFEATATRMPRALSSSSVSSTSA